MIVEGTPKLTNNDERLLDYYLKDNHYVTIEPTRLQLKAIVYALRPNKDGLNDILVGGSAGVGKSYLGACLCQMFLKEPNHNSLVIRNTYDELTNESSIFSLLKQELNIYKEIKVTSNPPKIMNKDNNSTIEFFSCNDVNSIKSHLQGTSFQFIFCDESSYMPVEVLQFVYRSLRKTKDIMIPLKLVHASNPSIHEATAYLRENYIEGDRLFIPSKFGQNPYMDDNYKETLQNLNNIEKRYLIQGDWYYTPQSGDLISEDMFNTFLINPNNYEFVNSYLSVDEAGTGDDLTVVTHWLQTKNNEFVMNGQYSTKEAKADDLTLQLAYRLKTNTIIVEGGYQATYLVKSMKEKIMNHNLKYRVIEQQPKGSKYDRASLLVKSMLDNKIMINENCNYSEFEDELLSIYPNYKGASPNYLDSASIFNLYILNNKVYSTGGGVKLYNINTGANVGFNHNLITPREHKYRKQQYIQSIKDKW